MEIFQQWVLAPAQPAAVSLVEDPSPGAVGMPTEEAEQLNFLALSPQALQISHQA